MSKKDKKRNENPIMMDEKSNKKAKKLLNRNIKETSEDENLIRNFIILIVVIAIIIGIVYFASEALHKEKKTTAEKDIPGSINYNIVSVGTLLNRPYDEYYVLVYNSEASEAPKYSTLYSMYLGNEDDDDFIKAYYCDLNEPINAKYYNVGNDNKSNPKAKKIEDFDFGDLTLLRIKKGQIVEYIEDYTTIQEKLK